MKLRIQNQRQNSGYFFSDFSVLINYRLILFIADIDLFDLIILIDKRIIDR